VSPCNTSPTSSTLSRTAPATLWTLGTGRPVRTRTGASGYPRCVRAAAVRVACRTADYSPSRPAEPDHSRATTTPTIAPTSPRGHFALLVPLNSRPTGPVTPGTAPRPRSHSRASGARPVDRRPPPGICDASRRPRMCEPVSRPHGERPVERSLLQDLHRGLGDQPRNPVTQDLRVPIVHAADDTAAPGSTLRQKLVVRLIQAPIPGRDRMAMWVRGRPAQGFEDLLRRTPPRSRARASPLVVHPVQAVSSA